MYKEVSIARFDGKDEPTPMLANAATPLRYKHIFEEDLLTLFANAKQTDADGNERYSIDFLGELAFVMAMQAASLTDKNVKMERLNQEQYINWLEQFDSMAIENASEDILNVYLGNTKTDSESKKNSDEQNES